VNNKEIKV